MTPPRTLQRIERWIWVLVYGGLLTLVLGIATERTGSVIGWVLIGIGGVVAAIGVVLIFVRARLRPD